MLGKLMKYEWKATWKMILPMDAFVVLMSILLFIMMRMSFFDSDNHAVTIMGVAITFSYIFGILAIVLGTIIYLIYRFYTSVYGDEGYLLHTLPLDKHHIIIAKALVSAGWVIFNILVIVFCVNFAFASQTKPISMLLESAEVYAEVLNEYDLATGFSILMTYVASIVAVLARILKIMACASLGQMASNHKVLASFGFYYGIYVVQRMLEMLSLAILGLLYTAVGDTVLFASNWETELISGLIYCVLFYFITWYMMDKKLNLD